MNAKTNTAKPEEKELQAQPEKEKICFVIMPIADIPGYDSGHFTRVYNHLIKPACKAAGFKAIRADDVSSSHMIVVDILQKIIESDIAICDLSGRNPNVLYELGLRQAFNKKTVLIKDNKTENIFDVQGFRHTLYDNALRIDNVNNEVTKISNSLTETFEAKGDINSIVQLLEIEPAEIGRKTKLSDSETLIFRSISELSKKIDSLEVKNNGIGLPASFYKKHGISKYNFGYKKNVIRDKSSEFSFQDIISMGEDLDAYKGGMFTLSDNRLTFMGTDDNGSFLFRGIDYNNLMIYDTSSPELDNLIYVPL
ncbi:MULTISPECIES: hypothetical protein [Pectobacterium]|uniref:hypothetical protein n=1 Tax=Pectobacterium TaxID=122277 RepID=UPI0018DAA6EC|nr:MULTISPECIES: hypothetical protein [Pectobacterium]QPI41954.1 hypothetical protein I2D83_16040 [Pectobacterium aroidearum]